MNASNRSRFRRSILAFDGGGIRGIFQAALIAELHHRTGLLDHIDVFAGTSTGGIMAMALAYAPSRFAELPALYSSLGRQVFCRKRDLWRCVCPFVARYASTALERQLSSYFSGDASEFGKCQKQCLIACVSLARHRIEVFNSLDSRHSRMNPVDILLSSCSAPTFFAPHGMESGVYVDGGLGCNNPAYHVVNCLLDLGEDVADLRVLSIGSYSFVSPWRLWLSGLRSSLSWARLVIAICMDASAAVAHQYCTTMLQQRYLRLDGELGPPIDIKLDDYGRAIEYLPQIASEIAQSPETVAAVKAWLAS